MPTETGGNPQRSAPARQPHYGISLGDPPSGGSPWWMGYCEWLHLHATALSHHADPADIPTLVERAAGFAAPGLPARGAGGRPLGPEAARWTAHRVPGDRRATALRRRDDGGHARRRRRDGDRVRAEADRPDERPARTKGRGAVEAPPRSRCDPAGGMAGPTRTGQASSVGGRGRLGAHLATPANGEMALARGTGTPPPT